MKVNLGLGYASLAATVGSNIIILPAAYEFMNAGQIGLWFNYLAVYSLVLLLDFGVTVSASRAFSKYYFELSGLVDRGRENDSVKQFVSLFRASRIIYFKIAFIGFVVSMVFGTLYLYSVSGQEGLRQSVLVSWPVFCVGIFFHVKNLYYFAALKGVDRVELVYLTNVISKMSQVVMSVVLLYWGLGLLAISIAFVVSTSFSRVLHKFFFNKKIGLDVGLFESAIDPNGESEITRDLTPKVMKQGVMSLANFFQDKASVFYVTAYCGVGVSGKYGLTVQLLGLLAAVGNVYYNSIQAKMIASKLDGDYIEVCRFLKRSFVAQVLLIFFGGLFLYGFGDLVLLVFGVSDGLVSSNIILLLLLYCILFNIQLVSVNYLVICDDFSMVSGYVYSALAFAFSLFVYSHFFPVSVFSVCLIQLVVLAAYNAWIWPKKLWFVLFVGGGK